MKPYLYLLISSYSICIYFRCRERTSRWSLGWTTLPDTFWEPCETLESGNFTFKRAEEGYGVPRTVIFNRINGRKTPVDKWGIGRPTDLSPANELEFVYCIKAQVRMGYSSMWQRRYHDCCRVHQGDHTVSLSKDGVPGAHWYYIFSHTVFPVCHLQTTATRTVSEIYIANDKKPTIQSNLEPVSRQERKISRLKSEQYRKILTSE